MAPTLPTVFMFSGQGSQYYQAGLALLESNEVFRHEMMRMDRVVRESSGFSVTDVLYSPAHSKGQVFDRALFTGPAIYMLEYALARTLQVSGLVPDFTLGCSLGSFAAAAVSEMVDPDAMLRLVVRHAEILERCCERGGMLAIFAAQNLCDEPFLKDRVELAGVNFATHFVVTGGLDVLSPIERDLSKRGIIFQRLPVSFAFHSRSMDVAYAEFREATSPIVTHPGTIPMICCERAATIDRLPSDYFWNVARNPIRFLDAIRACELSGPKRYIDVGPSGTLATFLKYIVSPESLSQAQRILTPFGGELKNFDAVVEQRLHSQMISARQ